MQSFEELMSMPDEQLNELAESMGMKHEVTCECYVKDKKVRYLKWRED